MTANNSNINDGSSLRNNWEVVGASAATGQTTTDNPGLSDTADDDAKTAMRQEKRIESQPNK